MVGNVLSITTEPIKFEMTIEPARLEMRKEQQLPLATVQTTPPKMQMHSDYTKVQISTKQARSSMGQGSMSDFMRTYAQKGKNHILQKTGEYAQMGWEMSAQHPNGVNIAQVVNNHLNAQPNLALDFIPKGGAQLSWEPAVAQMNYQKGNVQYQWEWPTTKFEYIPGKIDVKVLQWPSVNVEYLGSPMYVPASASPDYEE